MAAALFSAAAHISAVWPRELFARVRVGAVCEQRFQHFGHRPFVRPS